MYVVYVEILWIDQLRIIDVNEMIMNRKLRILIREKLKILMLLSKFGQGLGVRTYGRWVGLVAQSAGVSVLRRCSEFILDKMI